MGEVEAGRPDLRGRGGSGVGVFATESSKFNMTP